MKKTVTLTVFSVLIVAIVGMLSFGHFELAGAQVVVSSSGQNPPIGSMSIGLNDCGNLDSRGATYSLTQDVSLNQGQDPICFKVLEDMITLNCNGHKIKGIQGRYATEGYGIVLNPVLNRRYVSGYSQPTQGFTARNCVFEDFSIAMLLGGLTGGEINDVSVSNSGVSVELVDSRDVQLTNSAFKNTEPRRSVVLRGDSDKNYIEFNSFSYPVVDWWSTLMIQTNSDFNTVRGNKFYSQYRPGQSVDAAVKIEGESNRILENTIDGYAEGFEVTSTGNGFYRNMFRNVENRYAFPSSNVRAQNDVDFIIDSAGDPKATSTKILQDADVIGASRYQWSQVSGPGRISFGSPNSEDTVIEASTDGDYTIRLTAWNPMGEEDNKDVDITWFTPASSSIKAVKDYIATSVNVPNYDLPRFYSLGTTIVSVQRTYGTCLGPTYRSCVHDFEVNVNGQTTSTSLQIGQSEVILVPGTSQRVEFAVVDADRTRPFLIFTLTII